MAEMETQYQNHRFIRRRYSSLRYSLVEIVVANAIISVLIALLIPAARMAKTRSAYTCWQGHKKNVQADSATIAFYTFEAGAGTILNNTAEGPTFDANYVADYYHGTIHGAHWTTGRWSDKPALYFNGANNYVDVGYWNIPAIGESLSTATLAAWFKANSFDIIDMRLVSKAVDSDTANHWFMLSTIPIPGGIGLRTRFRSGGSTILLTASSGLLLVNQWHLAVCTYDGSKLKLYKDGVLVGSATQTGTIDVDDEVNVRIGANANNLHWFDGSIGEVCVMRRELSADEVLDYYRTSKP